MFCEQCGAQIKEKDKFCPKCGKKIEGPVEMAQDGIKKTGSKLPVVILSMAGAAAVIGIVVMGIWFMKDNHKSGADTAVDSQAVDLEEQKKIVEGQNISEGKETGNSEPGKPLDTVQEDSVLARTISDMNSKEAVLESIYVYSDSYKPAKRDTSLKWNSKLFYSLEDIDPEKTSDGLINGYNIEKKQLVNEETGNMMEYEIYRNPDTEKVNKIVSIEYYEDYLEITDYYYTNEGKINFIFVKKDVNYVPSYAAPTIDGSRYYFNDDVMVKWRTVKNGKQTNYTVGKNEKNNGYNAGKVYILSSVSKKKQNTYNAKEKRMVNAAYNTYDIVLKATGISNITGYVYDENGLPFTGANVSLYTDEYDKPVYDGKTGIDGKYSIFVPSEDRTFRIIIREEGYVETELHDINMNNQIIDEFQESVYLIENTGNQIYDVNMTLCDAFNYDSYSGGMLRLDYADIKIRKGVNNKNGTVYQEGTADSDGQILLSLDPGMYTIQVIKNGYESTYYTVTITKNSQDVTINTSPSLKDDEVRIVLTWDAIPQDLDSHLFTPYDLASGDATYHIWYGNKADYNENNLDVDDRNGYGPETMTISRLGDGLYKFYVVDYTDCSSGNYISKDMSNSGATVNVYTNEGLVQTFHVPGNRNGVIWEVFEIRNKKIVPLQRYYSNTDDKTWWNSEK